MKITEMHITPIALGDPPLLNAAGLHAPYCLRTVVELKTDNGLTGLAEVPGSVAVDAALAAVRDVVIGADPRNWHGLRARLAGGASRWSSPFALHGPNGATAEVEVMGHGQSS